MDKGAFRFVDGEKIPPNASILSGRFVLALKTVGTKGETHKARIIVQEYKDAEKNMVVHSSTNLNQQSIRLVVSLAAIFEFRLWTQDTSQAYLQN